MQANQGYDMNDIRSIMQKVGNAFIALRDGGNRPADFNTLAGAMNIGLIRAESFGDGAEQVFRQAQGALLQADQAYSVLHTYTFDGSGLIALAKGVQGYSELLFSSTPEQMQAAMAECEKRLGLGYVAKLNAPAYRHN